MPLDIALRAAGASLLLLTAVALLLSAPRAPVARWFLPFALGAVGFLGVNTAFDEAELPAALWQVAGFLSRMAAVFLWIFCLVLSDGRLRAPRPALAVACVWLVLVLVDRFHGGSLPGPISISALQIAIGSGLLLHAAGQLISGRGDDLVEPRRRARPLFVLALLAFLALDFIVDVVLGFDWMPASFVMLQNGLLVLLSAALALWLLCAAPWIAAEAAADTAPRAVTAAPPADDPELAAVARIQALMQSERPWLDPELDIATFAQRVGLSEPLLRRAINHRLGHGHFRNFLNGYRVEEARRRLRDPAHAGDKILAIALDSGFSSLPSFNRAFRQITGCTPSEYRAGSGPAPQAGRG